MLNRKTLWSEWLEEIDWTYFATFTTPYELTLNSARRFMEIYYEVINKTPGENIIFWVGEKFKLKDGCHVHALIKTTPFWSESDLWNLWQKKSRLEYQISEGTYNRCDIRKRDPKKAAGSYLCKYMTKSMSKEDNYGIL